MITIQFRNARSEVPTDRRTFGDWISPHVIAAYCTKRGWIAEIINVR